MVFDCPKNVLIAALIGNRIQKTVKTKTERGVNLLHIARNITLCGGGFVAIKVFHFALKCRIGTFEIAENSKPEQIIMKQFHLGADARNGFHPMVKPPPAVS